MRRSPSRSPRDHTTNYRHGKRLRRTYRRGVPGHYAPRTHIAMRAMLWINYLHELKTLFGNPPHIGGGEGLLFAISRSRYAGTRYRIVKDGQFKGWWTNKRPEIEARR